jgi:hypothetical protein
MEIEVDMVDCAHTASIGLELNRQVAHLEHRHARTFRSAGLLISSKA